MKLKIIGVRADEIGCYTTYHRERCSFDETTKILIFSWNSDKATRRSGHANHAARMTIAA